MAASPKNNLGCVEKKMGKLGERRTKATIQIIQICRFRTRRNQRMNPSSDSASYPERAAMIANRRKVCERLA
jgi:hypothetical protein